jgi:hypothetical protein
MRAWLADVRDAKGRMSAGYKPRTGSLPYKLIEFFNANPDESLTIADVRTKFGPLESHQAVYSAPRLAVNAGYLQRHRTREGVISYARGPKPLDLNAIVMTPAIERAMAAPMLGRRDGSPVLQQAQQRPFACALFSDGRMHLNVGGAELTLMPTETTRLIRYLARMGENEACGSAQGAGA